MASSNEDLIGALAQAQTALQPLFDHLQHALRRIDELECENRALRENVQHQAATTIQRCFRRWRILHQVRDMIYELGLRRRLQRRRLSTRTLETESSSDDNYADAYPEPNRADVSDPRRLLLMELERRISDYVDFEILQNGLRRPSGMSDDGTVLQGTPRNTLMFPPIDVQALTRYTADGGSDDDPGSARKRSVSSPYPSVLMTPVKDEGGEDRSGSGKCKRRFATLLESLRRSPKVLFDRDESSHKYV